MTRRGALRLGALGLLGSLAGCAGGSGGQGETTAGGADESDGEDENTLSGHPGAAGLSRQPYLGADPESASAVIVAFEDPSCTTCRRFERQTLPTLQTELLEPGTASFVFRGLGIIYDWGEPAAKALEATLARSEPAHWALKAHYYDQQRNFDAGNVLDRTASFLDRDTEVEGAAVIEDVDSGAADEEYGIDLDAANAVGVRATPTFLLFTDGTYVTQATGAVSYDVLATSLGV
jgi:protein-disulfide isomerase